MAMPQLAAAAKQAATAIASNPRVRMAANDFIARATQGRVTDVGFAPKTSSDQALVVQAAVVAGIRPDNIWAGIEEARMNAAEKRIYASTMAAHGNKQQTLDAKFAIPEGARDHAQRLMDRELVSWARDHFGSTAAAIRAHAQLRAFMALDSDDLHELFKTFG